MVKSLGNQLLASAAFPNHKDRAIERRGAARPLDRVEKGKALTDKLIGPFQLFGSLFGTNMWW